MGLNKAASSSRHPAAPRTAIEETPAVDMSSVDALRARARRGAVDGPGNVVSMRGGQTRDQAQAQDSPAGDAEEHREQVALAPEPEPVPAASGVVMHQVPPLDPQRVAAMPEGLVLPPVPPGNVRRVEVSKRGKRDFNYSWARVDVQQMRAVYDEYRPIYRNNWQQVDGGGTYRLVFSAFVAKALLVAFEDIAAWAGTIRNDARKQPVEGGREQVGLVWPVEVENRVVDEWETFDRSLLPEGFALTKQHLASAAILHGLGSVKEWVMSVPNDDRFNVPVQDDGRLRQNRATLIL